MSARPPDAGPRKERRALAALGVASAALIWLYGRIPYDSPEYRWWDLQFYRPMAEAAPGLAEGIRAPFAHRVLGPWLAGLLPLAEPTAFYALTVVASAGLLFLFYGLARRAGLPPGIALAATLCYALNRYLFGTSVWDFFQLADVLALVAIVAGLAALWAERWATLAVVLAAGVLAKETVLVLAPVAAVFALERRPRRARLAAAVAASVPAVAVFLLLRAWIDVPAGYSLDTELRTWGAKILSPEHALRLLVNAFVPLSLVPLVFPGATVRFFAQRPHLLALFVLVLLSTLFAANDERLMAPAFPAFYLLLGTLLRDRAFGRLATVVLLGAAAAATPHHFLARHPLPSRSWTVALSLGALAAATLVAALQRLRARRP